MIRRRRGSRTRHLAAGIALTSAALVACGDDDAVPTLRWYTNPDNGGQAALAAQCTEEADGRYRIVTEDLPNDASQQRIQLARRLAADDGSIDMMSLDPVFVPEFADAGFLAEIPDDYAARYADEDVLQGAVQGATWRDRLVAAPLWANTQLLWYRKDLAEAAGLDMTQPVTWEQVIAAAADNGGTVGVQANRYEGYVVWINALIAGAGGDIVSNTEEGPGATIDIDSDAGRQAAEIIQQLVRSGAAQPDLPNSNEGTVLGPMFPRGSGGALGPGAFIVNWTFVYQNYAGQVGGELTDDEFAHLGWARYPQTVAGEPSRPPLGGIDIGIGAFSSNQDLALEAVACVTTAEKQASYAVQTGNMPARASAYDDPELREMYPADLLDLFRESIQEAGPRPQSAYYSDISLGIQSTWHPPAGVDPGTTPADSASFLDEVLRGETLL